VRISDSWWTTSCARLAFVCLQTTWLLAMMCYFQPKLQPSTNY
jgi:hypothetical protein